MTTSSNRSRDDAGENKAVLDLAREAVAGIKGIHQRLDEADGRINHLEAELDAGRGGGGRSDAYAAKAQDTTFRRFLKGGCRDEGAYKAMLDACPMEYKAMSLTDAEGGYTVPEQLAAAIEAKRRELSPWRMICRVVNVSTSLGDYTQPVSIGGTTSGWAGEQDSRSATNTPVFVKPTFTHGDLYAYPAITEWVLDDSRFNLQQFLSRQIADEFNVAESTAIVSGDGTKKPTGMLYNAPVATDDDASPLRAYPKLEYIALDPGSSPSDGIQADALADVVYGLKTGYHPRAVWVMRRTTAAFVRKMKDNYGQYLWQPGLSMGQPPTLLGYPVYLCDELAAVGQNNLPILFGDFDAGYHIVQRPYKFTADPYTAPGFVKLHVRQRVGGAVVDNDAVKAGKCAAA